MTYEIACQKAQEQTVCAFVVTLDGGKTFETRIGPLPAIPLLASYHNVLRYWNGVY